MKLIQEGAMSTDDKRANVSISDKLAVLL